MVFLVNANTNKRDRIISFYETEEIKAIVDVIDLHKHDDGTILLRCAAGHEPVRQSYTKTTRQCKVSFNCNHCVGCPYQGSVVQKPMDGIQHSLLQRMLQTGQRAKGICKVKNSAIMQSLGMA